MVSQKNYKKRCFRDEYEKATFLKIILTKYQNITHKITTMLKKLTSRIVKKGNILAQSVVVGMVVTVMLIFTFSHAKFAEAQIESASSIGSFIQNVLHTGQNNVSVANSTFQKLKDFGFDKAATIAGKKLLGKLTDSVINWAARGFEGEPFYVANQERFLQSVADDEVVKLVNTLLDESLTPLGRDLASAIISDYTQVATDRLSFDLDKIIEGGDWESYADDFSVGGWDAWLSEGFNPANNIIGSSIITGQELERRLLDAQGAVSTELLQNSGFFNMRECVGGTELPFMDSIDFTILEYEISSQNECKAGGGEWRTVTPGQLIANKLGDALGTTQDQLTEVDEFTDIVSNALFYVMDNFLEKGVSSLSSSISPSNDQPDFGALLNTIENASSSATGINFGSSFFFEVDLLSLDPNDLNILEQRFKDIDRELLLYRNNATDALDKGIINLIDELPTKLLQLDACIPGPDAGWKQRLNAHIEQRKFKVDRKASLADNDSAINHLGIINEFLPEKRSEIEFLMTSFNVPRAQIWLQHISSAEDTMLSKRALGTQYGILLNNKTILKNLIDELAGIVSPVYVGPDAAPILLGYDIDVINRDVANEIAKSYLALLPTLSTEDTVDARNAERSQMQSFSDLTETYLEQCLAFRDPLKPSCPLPTPDFSPIPEDCYIGNRTYKDYGEGSGSFIENTTYRDLFEADDYQVAYCSRPQAFSPFFGIITTAYNSPLFYALYRDTYIDTYTEEGSDEELFDADGDGVDLLNQYPPTNGELYEDFVDIFGGHPAFKKDYNPDSVPGGVLYSPFLKDNITCSRWYESTVADYVSPI